tara:strand:- start:54 stop:233 length:180 start_codon:yes stop_codon:yes gene_type:complete
MTKGDFDALTPQDRVFFEYLVDRSDVYGFETVMWHTPGKHEVEFIPTLKGLHFLKHYTP